ncbi:MAG: hypothetical protein JZU60_02585 [Ilumatobacteraceae bacterium]|nr:hypothetical protein [Ilumatobacteraceae bacterium]
MQAKGYTDGDGTLHEIYTGAVIVNGDYLGPISYDSGRADLRWQRSSLAYFCPKCGDVWGRIAMSDSRGAQQSFLCVHVACAEHKDPWHVPGTLLVDHVKQLLDELPPRAIQYELTVQINHALKESL